MAKRTLLLLPLALASLGASYRTKNFLVRAPTARVAEQVGRAAERCRRAKALYWLGRELPTWPTPCPLRVTLTPRNAGGATTVHFSAAGRVVSRDIHVEGPLDRLLESVLPHEVTHAVLADHFGRPPPRWADEGAAVLAEDVRERRRQDRLVGEILRTPGRAIPLRRLFALGSRYPPDTAALYAEGYAVTRFLVESGGRPTYLAFVAQGLRDRNWDEAAQAHYGYGSVEALERAWLRQQRKRAGESPGPAGRDR